MSTRPRIALIHATPIAVDPIKSALAAGYPDAESINILDDSLTTDRLKSTDITPELDQRILDLAEYARRVGSDGILFTCSAFGSSIEAAARKLDVPVLKPNEAMFEAAIAEGGKVAMLYTFAPAREGMEEEFREEAARLNPAATITSIHVPDAIDALRAGDAETHNRLVAEKAKDLKGFDAIVLAHFSTSRAAPAVRNVTDIPVLTSPEAAVVKIKRLLAPVHA